MPSKFMSIYQRLFGLILLSAVPVANAVEHPRAWQLGIALGYGQQQDPLISREDRTFYFLLDIAYYGRYGFFDNGDAGIYLYNNESSAFNFVITRSNARDLYDPVNHLTRGIRISSAEQAAYSPAQNDGGAIGEPPTPIDIPARETSTEAGIELLMEHSWGSWQAQWLRDASSTHNGYEWWATYTNAHTLGGGNLSYTLGVTAQNADFVDYYYGVDITESTLALPAYRGNATTNWFAKLAYSYPLNEKLHCLTLLNRTAFGTGIHRSPLVYKEAYTGLFVGLYYRFY